MNQLFVKKHHCVVLGLIVHSLRAFVILVVCCAFITVVVMRM